MAERLRACHKDRSLHISRAAAAQPPSEMFDRQQPRRRLSSLIFGGGKQSLDASRRNQEINLSSFFNIGQDANDAESVPNAVLVQRAVHHSAANAAPIGALARLQGGRQPPERTNPVAAVESYLSQSQGVELSQSAHGAKPSSPLFKVRWLTEGWELVPVAALSPLPCASLLMWSVCVCVCASGRQRPRREEGSCNGLIST